VSDLTRVTDHVEQGLALLLDQYKRKPRIEAWVRSYLRQVQVLEDAAFDVRVKRLLDNAEGVLLDVIGRIVGEPRRSRGDDVYRLFIAARIRINRSKGGAQDVLAVLAIIAGGTPTHFDERSPAVMLIEFQEPTEHDPVLLLGMLRDTKAGGMGLRMLAPTTRSDRQFRWGDARKDLSAPARNGVGDVTATSDGGLVSDVVTMRGQPQ